jgi:membrane-bound lytic murein transglycosylase D
MPPLPEAKVEKSLRIPIEMNPRVEKWIQYFSEKDHERFQRFLDRGEIYRDVVENVLDDNDLPAELFYLPMIESGYRTSAHSHAKAVGVWQFMVGTGQRYGLRVDHQVDERRDPIRATEAASRYLRDLYNVFGSWHLAMAAYNAGEIRILRAIFKGRTRNFWELADAHVLPAETAEYVPKFMAVVLITKDPEKYGFQVANPQNDYPDLKAVEVPGGVTLAQIANSANISEASLKQVNPQLLHSRTPAGERYEIWVPMAVEKSVVAAMPVLDRLSQRQKRRLAVASSHEQKSFHIVRAGESLSTIARRYRMSIGHIKRMNGLHGNTIRIGRRLRIEPPVYVATRRVRYKVRRGDNLTMIAQKFSTSVKKLKAKNHLKQNKLLVGQILQIH